LWYALFYVKISVFIVCTAITIHTLAISINKMLSYRRETALQGTLVLAESGRLELRDNILLIL